MSKATSFETSIKSLEEIVGRLEQNEIPLDDAIKAFEESQKLISDCEKQLSTAEKRLLKLVKTSGTEENPEEDEQDRFQLELI